MRPHCVQFFLSKNKEEGSIMKAKAERDRDLEKSQIKAKSKKTKAEKVGLAVFGWDLVIVSLD